PAIKAYLTAKRRLTPDQADDLFQGFVVSKVLEQDLIAWADRGKGKFRTWLLTALDRYLISQWRRQTAARRAGPGAAAKPSQSASPAEVLDLAWAREVIAEVLRRMESECAAAGRPDLWGVFHCRVLAPTLEGAAPLPYDELVRRFRFASPVQASNALITAKRAFARLLRAVVGEYADPAEVEAEIHDLRRILARGGAGS